MSPIGIVLCVIFAIICVLLGLLLSIQDDGENGMGGLLGGRGTAAFGSHSASVLTKTTAVFVTLFFLLAVGLAIANKSGKKVADTLVEETVTEETTEEAPATEWWQSAEAESSAEAEEAAGTDSNE